MELIRSLIDDGLDTYTGLKSIDWIEFQQLVTVNNRFLRQKAEQQRRQQQQQQRQRRHR